MTFLTEPFPHQPSPDARKVYEIEFRCMVIDRSHTIKGDGDGDGDHYGMKVGTRFCHVLATSEPLARAAWAQLHGPGRMGCEGNGVLFCRAIAAIDGEITMRGHR